MNNLVFHKATKTHRCTPYFTHHCIGTGIILKGEIYYSPSDDCIDPFHPYRICASCVQNYANKGEKAMTKDTLPAGANGNFHSTWDLPEGVSYGPDGWTIPPNTTIRYMDGEDWIYTDSVGKEWHLWAEEHADY